MICLENEAFYKLLDKVAEYIKQTHGTGGPKWIPAIETMPMLGITSKTTLQHYRDEGRIRFSQPDKKIILYDVDSINEFLANNSKGTF